MPALETLVFSVIEDRPEISLFGSFTNDGGPYVKQLRSTLFKNYNRRVVGVGRLKVFRVSACCAQEGKLLDEIELLPCPSHCSASSSSSLAPRVVDMFGRVHVDLTRAYGLLNDISNYQ